MLTFYFIRHGQKETIPFDPPLTELGVKQAETTAEHLKNISFDKIIASPKLRTRQTAEIIAKSHSLQVFSDIRLIERLEWENDESFDKFLTRWNKTDIDRKFQPKKGKSSYSNGQQMRKVIDELSKIYRSGNMLIVTHGGSIGDLLRNLFAEEILNHKTEPISGARYIEILECSITKVQKRDGKYILKRVNDTTHLLM